MAKIKCEDIHGNQYEIEEAEFIETNRAYGVYVKEGKVLLVQDIDANYWELPGGGVEVDESLEAGLVREFKEETDLEVKKVGRLLTDFIGYFYHFRFKQPWKSHRHFYLIEEAVGELMPGGNGTDTAQAKFFNVEQIDNLPVKENIKRVIEKSDTQ